MMGALAAKLTYWNLDPMNADADKIIDLYERHAHDYVADRQSVRWNERAWLDRFSALLAQGAAILDIGTSYSAR